MQAGGHDVKLGEKVAAVRLITRGDSFEEAMDIATRLNLTFEYRATGYGDLETSLVNFAKFEQGVVWQR